MGRESSTHRDFRYAQSLLVEKREAKRRIAKPELDGTTLLKWNLKEKDTRVWIKSGSLEQNPLVGLCEYGNEFGFYKKRNM